VQFGQNLSIGDVPEASVPVGATRPRTHGRARTRAKAAAAAAPASRRRRRRRPSHRFLVQSHDFCLFSPWAPATTDRPAAAAFVDRTKGNEAHAETANPIQNHLVKTFKLLIQQIQIPMFQIGLISNRINVFFRERVKKIVCQYIKRKERLIRTAISQTDLCQKNKEKMRKKTRKRKKLLRWLNAT
jgi:hypothetical protein